MSEITQDGRLIAITSPLGKDELLLYAFEGVEHISDLFNFQIDVLSKNQTIKPEDLIGKTVTLTIQDKQKRTFNGYISRFSFGEIRPGNLRHYRLEMVPWLWFLSKTHDHRIFQDKSTKDIVSQVFSDLGFNDFEFNISSTNKREYCVQHNESDLNFVSRLLEEDGIAYYFEQNDKRHILHLVDAANAYQTCPQTDFTYSKDKGLNELITAWKHQYEFRKGKWSVNDYDSEMPTKSQIQTTDSTSKFANAKNYEHYEYTATYDFPGIKTLSKQRIEAEEVPMNVVEGSSACSSFYAGGKFKIKKHVFSEEQGGYIITSIKHKAHDDSYLISDNNSSFYENEFRCIPEEVHFRPPLVHQKSRVYGPQSATVTGPSGEEIYTDQDGRIKVQFHWDREGKKDENSSCYLRVMQPWAGATWGTSFIPRIGMEVVVDFFNGDPDRPIVTGSLYNGDNKQPYTSKTQSGIKTRSTKGGSSSNFNELRFDDKKGQEEIFLQAEKDLNAVIENNETHEVGNDRSKNVGNNESSSIGKSRDKSVGENQSESIGKNKTIDVGENHTENIAKNKTMDVGGNHAETIGGNMSLSIGKKLEETIGDDMSVDVGKAYTVNVGKNLGIVAADQIVLKTGKASITMKKNGDIIIKGKNVNVQGSGKINIKASSAVAIKGSKVTNN